jgi:hypothetical protein
MLQNGPEKVLLQVRPKRFVIKIDLREPDDLRTLAAWIENHPGEIDYIYRTDTDPAGGRITIWAGKP